MIEALEAEGRLGPGAVLVEPTSGNTGIGLAFVCAARGYRLILTMPESVSVERRKMLLFLGAEVVLTPREQGMKGAIAKAEEILAETPGCGDAGPVRQPGQPRHPPPRPRPRRSGPTPTARSTSSSPASAPAARSPAARQVLRPRSPGLRMVAVEPEASPVLSGGQPAPHPIQGIGAGFVPAILDTSQIDEIVTVGNEESFAMARRLARLEGIPGGISSGAAVGGRPQGCPPARGMAGKTHGGDHPLLRRALHDHGAVRGIVVRAPLLQRSIMSHWQQ